MKKYTYSNQIVAFIKSRTVNFWLLFLLCTATLISHTFYVLQTNQVPVMDEQHYMHMSSGFYKLLQNPTLSTPIDMLQLIPFRQPGYPFLILPFLLIFGIEHSYQWALWSNGIFYIVTIISTYFLAKEFVSKNLSLLASFIFATYGWSLFYLHFTYSETATTTFVVLSLLFLSKSNNFQNKNFSLLFGLAFGYGLFVRWVIPIFVAGPLLVVIYSVIIRLPKKQRKEAIKNIFLSAVITLVVGAAPYIANAQTFFGDYFKSQAFGGKIWSTVPVAQKNRFSLQAASYYFKVFEQLTFFFYVIFLAGLVSAVLKRKKLIFFVCAFIFPYILFSFATIIKDDRYIVPLYPVIAIISVCIFLFIKNNVVRSLLVVAILVMGIGNFLGGVWGVGPLGKQGLQSVLVPMPIGHPRYIHITTIVWPPLKNEGNGKQIMTYVEQNAKDNNMQNPNIVALFSYRPTDLGISMFNVYQRLKLLPFDNFVAAGYSDEKDVRIRVRSALEKADYILVKTGQTTDGYFATGNYGLLIAMNTAYKKTDGRILSSFEMLKTFSVPKDKSMVYIYRKKSTIESKYMNEYLDTIIAVLKAQKSIVQ